MFNQLPNAWLVGLTSSDSLSSVFVCISCRVASLRRSVPQASQCFGLCTGTDPASAAAVRDILRHLEAPLAVGAHHHDPPEPSDPTESPEAGAAADPSGGSHQAWWDTRRGTEQAALGLQWGLQGGLLGCRGRLKGFLALALLAAAKLASPGEVRLGFPGMSAGQP